MSKINDQVYDQKRSPIYNIGIGRLGSLVIISVIPLIFNKTTFLDVQGCVELSMYWNLNEIDRLDNFPS